jgi:hypothetical protein
VVAIIILIQWCRTEMIRRGWALKGVGGGGVVTRREDDKACRAQHDKHGKFQYLFFVLVILQIMFFEERA